jgi:hypothetical protein
MTEIHANISTFKASTIDHNKYYPHNCSQQLPINNHNFQLHYYDHILILKNQEQALGLKHP